MEIMSKLFCFVLLFEKVDDSFFCSKLGCMCHSGPHLIQWSVCVCVPFIKLVTKNNNRKMIEKKQQQQQHILFIRISIHFFFASLFSLSRIFWSLFSLSLLVLCSAWSTPFMIQYQPNSSQQFYCYRIFSYYYYYLFYWELFEWKLHFEEFWGELNENLLIHNTIENLIR